MPTVGFEPRIFRLRSKSATTELRGLKTAEWLKFCHILPECPTFRNSSVERGRWSKIIWREIHFVTSLQSANFLICQTVKRYKYYKTKKRHIVLINLPRVTGKFLKTKRAQVKPGELLSRRQISALVTQC